jgi:hypothetical protein
MVCKSEHKAENLQDAINDLTNKLTGYNQIDYGTKIIFLPVIAAAGTYVEFAVIDVRSKAYHGVNRFDLSDTVSRVNCFVTTINFFRLIGTMAPFIPTNPTPLFIKGVKNVEFNLNYVKKMISQTHTCPNELYELLGTGSVPCAVKVEKKSNYLKITPVGVRTPDNANDLSLQVVKSAIKSVLTKGIKYEKEINGKKQIQFCFIHYCKIYSGNLFAHHWSEIHSSHAHGLWVRSRW